MSDISGTTDGSSSSTADPAPAPLTQRLGGEALGTLLIVLLAGAAGLDSQTVGFAIVAAMFAFGRLTGGHFNPAVTIGSVLSGRTSMNDGLAYMGAQVVGGIVAGLFLLIFSITDNGDFFDEDLGVIPFGDNGGRELFSALLLEIVVTLLFVLIYLAITDKRNAVHAAVAPLGVGLAFTAVAATAVSANPARAIGPALFSGTDPIIQLWLFIVGPVIGAVAAGFAYNAVFGADREPVPGSGLNFAPKQPSHQGFAPGGYQQPGQQQWGQPAQSGYQQPGQPQQGGYAPPAAAEAAPQPVAEQPIIQDGWQWDPQAQQWIPAQQQPPQQGWAPGAPAAGEQTQIRPTDGS